MRSRIITATSTGVDGYGWSDAAMAAVYRAEVREDNGHHVEAVEHVRLTSDGRVHVWRQTGWTYLATCEDASGIDSSTGPDIVADALRMIHG